jgi:transcriptional regulator with XRE-family HTH domain
MNQRDMSAEVSEEARRMRLLRRAEGFANSVQAFAKRVGWAPNQLTNYESGFRRVPRDAALQLLKVTPGFDPVWLWTGEERGLSFDLRRRIEEARQAEDRELEARGNPVQPPHRNAS